MMTLIAGDRASEILMRLFVNIVSSLSECLASVSDTRRGHM